MSRRIPIPIRNNHGKKTASKNLPPLINLLRSGLLFHHQGKLDDAKIVYEKILQKEKNHFDATQLLGTIYAQLNMFELALEYFDKALSINCTDLLVLRKRGSALRELKRFDDALKSYEDAIRIKPDCVEAYVNRSNILKGLKRFDEALKSYDETIRIKPDCIEALVNKGNTLAELKQFDDALKSYDEAIRFKPDCAEAFNNKANAQKKLKQFDDALKNYEKAIIIKPDYAEAYGNLVLLRQNMADWSHWQDDLQKIQLGIDTNLMSGFQIFSIQSFPGISPKHFRELATKRLDEKLKLINPIRASLGFPPSPKRVSKLNIGFISGNFCHHIVSQLLSNFFEALNREKFNLFAYSYGVDDKSLIRNKVEKSFNVFRDVRFQSDLDIAKQIAKDQIHILIDITGQTAHNRLEITLLKPAPITIHMMSDPGTLGDGAVDYKILRKFVATQEIRNEAYAEALILLPPGIVFDTSVLPPTPDLRIRHELPDEAFIFCSFNQTYKINPPLFDCWMSILKHVPNGILWLWADDLGVQKRFKSEASARGIDESRLVFAKNLPLPQHYARMQLADLALDTFPYGSHTTGSHALWCGVPLLGFTDKTPVSRVSGSLLTACGLSELSIEGGYEAYADAAIKLARDEKRLRQIRTKLQETIRLKGEENPFNIKNYTQQIEFALEQAWYRHEKMLPVETFEVKL